MKFSKNNLREVMTTAWSFVKKCGFSMSEALKLAWKNLKLRKALHKGIVRFWFQKVDGSIREAYGTLVSDLVAPTKGTGKEQNPMIQVYYDTEKEQYRCFKKANLIKFVA